MSLVRQPSHLSFKAEKKCRSVKSSDFIFRLFLELYIELTIAALISPLRVAFSSTAEILDAILHIIALTFVVALPLLKGIGILREIAAMKAGRTLDWTKFPSSFKLRVFIFYFLTHRLLFAIAIVTFFANPRITLEILVPFQTLGLIFMAHTYLHEKRS